MATHQKHAFSGGCFVMQSFIVSPGPKEIQKSRQKIWRLHPKEIAKQKL